MVQKQKETVSALLKSDRENKSYGKGYWLLYKDFLDPTDDFTAFLCERLDGKKEYISLLENLFNADESAQIFVEIYGYEEDNNDYFIYADTLILFSILSLSEIKQIFNESDDIFPSDVGKLTEDLHKNYVISANGDLISPVNYCSSFHSVYYCWWD